MYDKHIYGGNLPKLDNLTNYNPLLFLLILLSTMCLCKRKQWNKY